MELRQLSYFVAVAEELHFGRAAARVHIAQPALSNQVQALEKELGVQLLTRTTRRVALTRAGEVFHDRCVRILRDVDLSTEATRSVAGRNVKINLGFIRPVENIGALRFFSIAQERYLLAVEKQSPLAAQSEIGLEDLRDQKIISFSRANLSYTERYFTEKFEEHDLTKNIAYSCDDSFSLVSLVSAGLGIGFAPEWTQDLPNRNFELRKVRGVDFRIGLGVAWNKEDPTASRDDIIDIARSLARPGR
ncbi:LysR family transcriptional regulator [Sinorhizobium numidicum]|uniref:LysR family transcriptional regulator n=1 Tax=Sinorhizobium numidicum TaxID=680248 RepID=A0ABY8CTS0_9HYPH|nr:LysR family transcriptional regulator [Sinorhizobium numidicum]WEX74733.1 LysR family transcriptional regulator [Sinorhizobium numidicum]WEX80725.1 LysR family transcriptional regulator [Sinorhizobium numidicum]